MKRIPLTQGKFAIVDDKDFESLSQHKWFALETKYSWVAARKITVDGKQIKVYMHRVIMNAPRGTRVTHIKHNELDNRKENLKMTEINMTGVKRIPLTRGRYAYLDHEDYEELNRFKWFAGKMDGNFFAARQHTMRTGEQVTIFMDAVIMRSPRGVNIVHKNRRTLDCRRSNLGD